MVCLADLVAVGVRGGGIERDEQRVLLSVVGVDAGGWVGGVTRRGRLGCDMLVAARCIAAAPPLRPRWVWAVGSGAASPCPWSESSSSIAPRASSMVPWPWTWWWSSELSASASSAAGPLVCVEGGVDA